MPCLHLDMVLSALPPESDELELEELPGLLPPAAKADAPNDSARAEAAAIMVILFESSAVILVFPFLRGF